MEKLIRVGWASQFRIFQLLRQVDKLFLFSGGGGERERERERERENDPIFFGRKRYFAVPCREKRTKLCY